MPHLGNQLSFVIAHGKLLVSHGGNQKGRPGFPETARGLWVCVVATWAENLEPLSDQHPPLGLIKSNPPYPGVRGICAGLSRLS